MKKKLLSVLLVTAAMSANAQQKDVSGLWRLKESYHVRGAEYANAVPKLIKIEKSGAQYVFEFFTTQGEKDTTIQETLQLDASAPSESITPSGRKKTMTLSWNNTKGMWMKQTEFSAINNYSQPEITINEDFQMNEKNDQLVLYKKFDAIENSTIKDFETQGYYERTTPEKLARMTQRGNGIQWTAGLSWKEILAKAKKEHKYIFVDCYATWCGPCKKMDAEIYPLNMVGDAMNDKFISVRVQMDSSRNDDANVKLTYPIARQIDKLYPIVGMPSYLFFDANGNLIHKELGSYGAEDFVKIINAASNPSTQLYTLAAKAKATLMPVNEVYDFIAKLNEKGDKVWVHEIIRAYINKYNKESESALLQKDKLEFLSQCTRHIKPTDRIFKTCYEHPEKVDAVAEKEGFASNLCQWTIINCEINSKVEEALKIKKTPDWNSIEASIKKNFGDDYLKLVMWAFRWTKTNWYKSKEDKANYYFDKKEDKDNYLKYLIEQMNADDLSKYEGDYQLCISINNPGWDVFQYSDDKEQMKQAIKWMDVLLETVAKKRSTYDDKMVAAWMDTKANLLYKSGAIKEGIELEEKAVALSASTWRTMALERMKKGERTYGIDLQKMVQSIDRAKAKG